MVGACTRVPSAGVRGWASTSGGLSPPRPWGRGRTNLIAIVRGPRRGAGLDPHIRHVGGDFDFTLLYPPYIDTWASFQLNFRRTGFRPRKRVFRKIDLYGETTFRRFPHTKNVPDLWTKAPFPKSRFFGDLRAPPAGSWGLDSGCAVPVCGRAAPITQVLRYCVPTKRAYETCLWLPGAPGGGVPGRKTENSRGVDFSDIVATAESTSRPSTAARRKW